MIGASIKRREDPRLITGQATYVDDIKLIGMLHMAILRSPNGHARITSIETGAARKHPGVVAVYTAGDLKGKVGNMSVGVLLPPYIEKGMGAAWPHSSTITEEQFFAGSYSMTYNLTGWPGVAVRGGTSPEGLPIGIQVVARPWREDVALAVAQHLETALGGWQRLDL